MLKRCVAMALFCALVFACGCGGTAGTETESTTEIELTTETEHITKEEYTSIVMTAKEAPNGQARVTITEINMAAPENQKYREWLYAYYTQYREWNKTRGNIPEPSTRQEGDEIWTTWNWSDAWDLELYENRRGEGMQILRARNKKTGEIQEIGRSNCIYGTDGTYYAVYLQSIIDKTSLLYSFAGWDIFSLHFYTLGQGSVQITRNENWSFINEECTLLYWSEYDYASDTVSRYCADLRKMAAGDSNAVWKLPVAGYAQFPLLDGTSIDHYLTLLVQEKSEPKHLTIWDLATRQKIYAVELPVLEPLGGWVWINANTQYYFGNVLLPWGDSIVWPDVNVKETEKVPFYEIRYEFSD